ncbi:RNA-directed DNA polymerase, partial [Thiolapillus sp.]|uniref:RNA-directed DNA polymerase n=1 Tax=Thiolapillus sp. TaxID=2017437 RepID=UPI003AF5A212
PSLDQDDLKNYRPVSNLSFLSKVAEKLVLSQLSEYLNANQLFSPVQSAYRPNHSTETALVKIVNDLLLALDDGKVSVLTLLDLSAAFDTIDHNILLHRLEHAFGITGTALSWIRSYLSDRDQTVVVNGLKSEPFRLLYGVPQGSVLGPVLFVFYTKPFDDIFDIHSVCHHLFADDTQMQNSSSLDQLDTTISA